MRQGFLYYRVDLERVARLEMRGVAPFPEHDRCVHITEASLAVRFRRPVHPHRPRFLPVFLVLALVLIPAVSQCRAAGHHLVNLSIFHPLSTNQDPEISTNLRLSLLHGRVGEVDGIDLNGLVSATGRNVMGIQLNGVGDWVGGRMEGFQVSNVFNYVQGETKGVQLAGLVNYQLSHLQGVQAGLLFNYTGGGYSGVQLAAVLNLNDGNGGFFQYSSVANVTGGDFRGLQLSGLVNFTNGRAAGFQVGMNNLASEMEGVQIGALNIARHMNGLQLGVINRSRRLEGIPIGLINSSVEDSRADALLFVDDKALLNVGVRTLVHHWYSILSFGFWDQVEQRKDTVFLRWNYGYSFSLGKRWHLGTDAGFEHIIPQPSDDPNQNDKLHFALQLRAMFEHRTLDGGVYFVGVGIRTRYESYSLASGTRTTGNLFAGVAIF